MYTVPCGRAWWPAVGTPLERGVRRRCIRGHAQSAREVWAPKVLIAVGGHGRSDCWTVTPDIFGERR
jgi:hypothetical protein